MQQQSIVQLSMVYEAVIPWKELKELEQKDPGSTGMQSLSQRELQRVAHHYRRQGMEWLFFWRPVLRPAMTETPV